MKTLKLVKNLLSETAEVKSSVGGTKEFRQACDFVNLSRFYQDGEERTPEQIAEMLESNFSVDVINKAKSVY